MDDDDVDEAVTKALNDLRAAVFQVLSDFQLACPKDLSHYFNDIVSASNDWLSFDPNFNYADSDEEDGEGDDDDDEDEVSDDDFSDDGEYDNEDDDSSWVVRRAACRTIVSVIKGNRQCANLWADSNINNGNNISVSKALLKRFKEREESVRVDIIDAYTQVSERVSSIMK